MIIFPYPNKYLFCWGHGWCLWPYKYTVLISITGPESLVAYVSDQTHNVGERAGMMSLMQIRTIKSDEMGRYI